mgnify:CR=1 FL=1
MGHENYTLVMISCHRSHIYDLRAFPWKQLRWVRFALQSCSVESSGMHTLVITAMCHVGRVGKGNINIGNCLCMNGLDHVIIPSVTRYNLLLIAIANK